MQKIEIQQILNYTSSTDFFGKTTKVYQVSELKKIMNYSIPDAKKYILTYFCKSSNGEHIFYYEPEEDGTFSITTIENLNGMVYKSLDDIPKKIITKWFNQEVDEYFKINSDPRADKFFTNQVTGQKYINLSQGFLHKVHKPYNNYSNETKEKVNTIIKHIKDTWCSGRKETYEYVLSWLSMALTGKKMPTALFLKSGEGTGKSIIVSFLIKYVIGEALGLITSRAGQLLKFNSQILGKVLLCLEELPTASKNEWHTVSEYLKDLITGHKLDIEKKFQDTVQVLNMISLIILTNNENTIKFGKDARRYMMCDVSHDNVGDINYFKKLSNACEDKLTGECFFMYLMEYRQTIEKIFDPEKIPMTENKLIIKESNSTEIIKFIKDIYIKNKSGIENYKLSKLKDIYNEHVCKNISTQQFKISLTSDIPILKIIEDAKKGHKIQNTTFDCLYKWFVQRGFWNEKYDMFNDIINTDNNDDNNMLSEQLEIKEEQNTKLQEQNTKLQEENNELKKQLEELKKILNAKNEPQQAIKHKKYINIIENKKISHVVDDSDCEDDIEDEMKIILNSDERTQIINLI